jgi:hypothetical protein
MATDFMIWEAMSGSGLGIGIALILILRTQLKALFVILKDPAAVSTQANLRCPSASSVEGPFSVVIIIAHVILSVHAVRGLPTAPARISDFAV